MERIFLTKYIIITGGVVSSIGKGITSASMGRILRSYGLKVAAIKIDPYLNWDSGTLNPYQHGEVFVTNDGMETDLDLGHYERFLDVELPGLSNITTGKVYKSVISKEREGKFLGACVQVIPHITNEIKEMIRLISDNENYDVVLIELGGTVGDIESQPFLEALRQLRNEEGHDNVMFVHVTFIPYLNAAGEFKTKPTQHSTKELRSMGINPDVIVCRSQEPIDDALEGKIAHFCDVDQKAVVNTPDAGTIYEVPLVLEENNIGELIVNRIGLDIKPDSSKLDDWRKIVESLKIESPVVNIGIVGKYVELEDAYISVTDALQHAGYLYDTKIKVNKVQAEDITEDNIAEIMEGSDGLIVPGGFGTRGLEGMITSIKYAREHDIPFLGICLGMQMASVEFARDVLGLKDANSAEADPETKNNIIDIMADKRDEENIGGTLRLGLYPATLKKGTKTRAAYDDQDVIQERHRHRYEFNNEFRQQFEDAGFVFSGVSPDNRLVEIVEVPENKFFVACQYHPELSSRPNRPEGLYTAFVTAAVENSEK